MDSVCVILFKLFNSFDEDLMYFGDILSVILNLTPDTAGRETEIRGPTGGDNMTYILTLLVLITNSLYHTQNIRTSLHNILGL